MVNGDSQLGHGPIYIDEGLLGVNTIGVFIQCLGRSMHVERICTLRAQ